MAIIFVLLGAAAEAGPVVKAVTYEPAATLVPVLHRRRAISTYCYRRSYRWFIAHTRRQKTAVLDACPIPLPYSGTYKQESRPYVRP